MNDLISIIIPVKNGSNYLDEAICGIERQGMNTEIIVVDDGSSDNTVNIAEKHGCIIVKHETTRGQVAGKNSGIKTAKGDYIIFHDHDDVMHNGALQKLYDAITEDENICAVLAKVQDFYSPDLSEDERAQTLIKKEAYWGLFSGATLMKAEVFKIIGLFTESIYAGEVLEWQTRMNSHGLKIKKLDFVSAMRRIHSTNFGKTNQQTEFKNYAAMLRERLKK